MELPIGVIEPLDRRHRKSRFAVLGIPVSYTTLSWLALPLHLALALPIALVSKGERDVVSAAQRGVALGLGIHLTNYLHSLGHMLAGRAVGAPMDELIVTATRQVNLYEGDERQYPISTHLARAAGGPLFNLVVAVLAYAIYRQRQGKPSWLATLAVLNALTTLVSLAPLESVDGGTILHYLTEK